MDTALALQIYDANWILTSHRRHNASFKAVMLVSIRVRSESASLHVFGNLCLVVLFCKMNFV